MKKQETNLILDYALSNSENLRIALLICEQYSNLRRVIVDKFEQQVCEELRQRCGKEWQIDPRSFFKAEEGIRLLKPAWKGKFDICVAADSSDATDIFVGVKNYFSSNQGKDGRLFCELNKHFRQGKVGSSWEWYAYLEQYRDWNSADILVALHDDRAVVDEIVYQLCRIQTVSEPIIDEYVSRA